MPKGNAAIVLVAIIAIAAALGAWWYWAGQPASTPAAETAGPAESNAGANTLPSGSATTDAALN